MSRMIDLLKEREQSFDEIWVDNRAVSASKDSYTVHYYISDVSLCIIATESNELNISILNGRRVGYCGEIYVAPIIRNYVQAEQILKFIESVFEESAPADYYVDIDWFVSKLKQFFK